MSFFVALNTYPLFAVCFALLIGLLVGSFLNVVIYRLPVMMAREEETAVGQFLSEKKWPVPKQLGTHPTFNLAVPASRCGNCAHKIRAWENIPVLSYLILKGKCSKCKQAISARYPLVEIVTGLMTAASIYMFGAGIEGIAAAMFSWCLITLTLIDFDTFLLPDVITLPLLWAGLILNYFGTFTDFHSAFWGAIWGYLALWIVYQIFKLLFKKEGMGFGDFKLLAALGAWAGWQVLPLIIVLSALVGTVIGISLMIFRNHDKQVPIPFGPYLSIAGWIALFFGTSLNTAYLSLL